MSKYLIEKYRTLTPYVPGEQPKDRVFLKLNTNESPYPPSPGVARAVEKEAGDLALYSDPECTDLRAALAELLGITPEELLMTNGSDEILYLAFSAFADRTRPLAFPDVTYGFYKVLAELIGIPYTEMPTGQDLIVRPSDYTGGTRTVVLANPNAPTGRSLPLADIEAIVKSNDGVVIVDEAYVAFGGESALPLIRKYDNLIVTRTFSKSRSMAGARLGFGAADPALIKEMNALKYAQNPYNVNRMTAAAGIAAIKENDYYVKNCARIRDTRQKTAAALTALGFTVLPSDTNFLFVKREGLGGGSYYKALRDRGILVRHFDTTRLRDYVRVTVGTPEQMERFAETTKEIIKEREQ